MIGIAVGSREFRRLLQLVVDPERAYVFAAGSALTGRQFKEIWVIGRVGILREMGQEGEQWLKQIECRLAPGGVVRNLGDA